MKTDADRVQERYQKMTEDEKDQLIEGMIRILQGLPPVAIEGSWKDAGQVKVRQLAADHPCTHDRQGV